MGNLITALDRVEWNSKQHRVKDLEAAPVANIYDNTAQTPESQRDINRAAALYSRASFQTQVAGSGTAGTAPFDGLLLQAMGLVESVDAGVSVTYSLSPTFTTVPVNLSAYQGNNVLVPVSNAIGKVEYIIEPGAPMLANWEWVGTYTEPSSVSGVATLGTTERPVICKGLVIPIAGIPLKLKQMRVVIENMYEEADEDACGTNGIINPSIYDRNITIAATFRSQLPSTKNWWNLLTSESKISFAVNLGATPGNIMVIGVDGYFKETIGPSKNAGRHETTIVTEMSRVSGDTAVSFMYT